MQTGTWINVCQMENDVRCVDWDDPEEVAKFIDYEAYGEHLTEGGESCEYAGTTYYAA